MIVDFSLTFYFYMIKMVREKSRECHNHKLQPILDTKRKRKQTKQAHFEPTYENTKISSLFPKRGFTGVYIIFLISAQKLNCGNSFEPPCRGGSNGCPQSMF